jgi:hypothetical protein
MNEKTEITDCQKEGDAELNADKRTIPLTFLIPCFNTPLLTSDLLYAVIESKQFEDCAVVLLLELSDRHLEVYKELVANVRNRGLNAGYLVSDGTPYAGKINRAALMIDSAAFCVLDNHMMVASATETGTVRNSVIEWLQSSPEPMKVGVFDQNCVFPVVSKLFTERLGYLYHPLCYGRVEAERWVISLAHDLEILSTIEGCTLLVSPSKNVDPEPFSTEADREWALQTLEQIRADEVDRLADRLIH